MLDLIARLGAPVIVATRSGLGTINHTCLTLGALRGRGVPVLGVVLSGPQNAANREAIEQFGNVKVLAEIPPLEPLTRESLRRVAPQPGALEWIRWKS
jgi:dethiobiotin synthetase